MHKLGLENLADYLQYLKKKGKILLLPVLKLDSQEVHINYLPVC